MYLYHMVIGEKDSDINIIQQNALSKGLSRRTGSRWYGNGGGGLFPELTERFRPANSPKWIDFNIAFGADLEPFEKPCLRFPIFSDKILVFNRDISTDLFGYMEDQYDGGKGYYTVGLPPIEDLIVQYWESMTTLDEYFKHNPYNDPEVLIFETVPGKLIEYIE
ncbi:hypothetical protein [Metabacillus fastidiosus]|uniref:hypothetical protein n=1 Tax=Metabacillus fastidiosus TaxID=1458 RepID=UPI002DC058DE|nr:hypothetical protein [Metabacillus fastidiosus]MEC2076333.1 hypothetical protein [Metabacillus fastidiosus]